MVPAQARPAVGPVRATESHSARSGRTGGRRGPDTGDPEPSPEFTMAFSGKRRGRDLLPDPFGQFRVAERGLRPALARFDRIVPPSPLLIVRRSGYAPGPQDTGQTIRCPGGGRLGRAHLFDLHRRKRFSSSICRVRSFNSSLSMTDRSPQTSASSSPRPQPLPSGSSARHRLIAETHRANSSVSPPSPRTSNSSPRISSSTTVTFRGPDPRPFPRCAESGAAPVALRTPCAVRILYCFLWTSCEAV